MLTCVVTCASVCVAVACASEFDTGVACNPDKPSVACPALQSCAYFDDNPGLSSFDSVAYATVILLQAVTFDDWAQSMCAPALTRPRRLSLALALSLTMASTRTFSLKNSLLKTTD